MKKLIVFYSYGGNTKKIAGMIAEKTGGDLLRIETEIPYSGTFDEGVAQGQEETGKGYMPKIKPLGLSEYDEIYLGTPVWWYTFAPAVRTFLAENDLSGKTIYPFATNGGWIGHTFADIRKACPHSDVKRGLDIRFDEHTLRMPERDIEDWIAKTKG